MIDGKLEPNELDWLIDDTLNMVSINDTLNRLGINRRQFNKLLKETPELNNLYRETQRDACLFAVNDVLNAMRKFKGDSKAAQVYANNLWKYLASEQPEKFGNKLDLNVSGQISIRANIEASKERVKDLLRDVSPVLSLDRKTDKPIASPKALSILKQVVDKTNESDSSLDSEDSE